MERIFFLKPPRKKKTVFMYVFKEVTAFHLVLACLLRDFSVFCFILKFNSPVYDNCTFLLTVFARSDSVLLFLIT